MKLEDSHYGYWHRRGVSKDILDTLGVEYSGNWFCIPIMDFQGKILYYKMKKIWNDEKHKKQPRFMYSHKGVGAMLWPLPYLHKEVKKVYLCEGESDVMAMMSQGTEAVTSTSGAKTFLPEWVDLFPADIEVVCCYDNDEAGEAGRMKVAELFKRRKDITFTHIRIPDECPGKDMTEYLLWRR